MSTTTTYITGERWGETPYYCRSLEEVENLIYEVCDGDPIDWPMPAELVEGVDYYEEEYLMDPVTGEVNPAGAWDLMDEELVPSNLVPVVPYAPAPDDAVEWVPFDN